MTRPPWSLSLIHISLSVRAAGQVSPELLRLAPALLYLPAGEGAAHPEVVEQAQKAGVRVAALLPRICTDREDVYKRQIFKLQNHK